MNRMKIRSLIASFLAGVLMMGSLSAACFAAGSNPVSLGEIAAEAASADETYGDSDATEAASTEGFTPGTETVLPDGVTIGEDGKFVFSSDSRDLSAEPEAAEKTVAVGTVNVDSDTYLNLRSGSGMEHSVIGHLLRDTEVEVVGESGNWYEVVVPETTGYVCKDYLDVTEQTAPVTGGFDEKSLMMLFCLMMNSMGNAGGEVLELPSNGLTPDGNLTLVDDYKESNEDGSGKQFITLVTKAGNTFYLIIDRDDEGEQTVHFLNLVDEADLLALMDEDEAAKYIPQEPEVQPPAETQKPEAEEKEDKPDTEKPAAKTNPAAMLVLVLALLGGGGFFVYTKFFKGDKKKPQSKPDPDADYSENDEDYGLPEDSEPDSEDGSDFDAGDDEPV